MSEIRRELRLLGMEAREVSSEAGPALILVSDDPDLLKAAAADPSAFDAVYHAFRLPVYRYLRSLVRTDEEAADLTSATFERALRNLRSYRGTGSQAGWLLRIARNAVVDEARRGHQTVPWQDAEARRLPAPGHSPDEAVLASEEHDALREAVRSLSSPTRDAIALRYAAGLSSREIGAVINKSEAATQKLITRGLAALKEAYRAQD